MAHLCRFPKGAAGAAPFALVLAAAAAGPGQAQSANFPIGQPVDGADATAQSPVLTLDRDRMFAESDFGERVTKEVAAAQAQLLAENQKKEAALADEEKTLTAERKTMAPQDFERLANAFDARVQKIRREQDSKNRIILAWREKERKRFYEASLPILGKLVRDSGAVAILNSQAVFLSFKAIDLTDRAIARLNEVLGDGAAGAGKIDLSAAPPADDGAAADPGDAPETATVPGEGGVVAPNGAEPDDQGGNGN